MDTIYDYIMLHMLMSEKLGLKATCQTWFKTVIKIEN